MARQWVCNACVHCHCHCTAMASNLPRQYHKIGLPEPREAAKSSAMKTSC
jgi:hypothetical protein